MKGSNMTILKLRDKQKKGTITPGEVALLKAKEEMDKAKKRGVLLFCEGKPTKKLKMDF